MRRAGPGASRLGCSALASLQVSGGTWNSECCVDAARHSSAPLVLLGTFHLFLNWIIRSFKHVWSHSQRMLCADAGFDVVVLFS